MRNLAAERLSVESDAKTIPEASGIVSRKKRSVILCALVIFLLLAPDVAFSLPKERRSTTTILNGEQLGKRYFVAEEPLMAGKRFPFDMQATLLVGFILLIGGGAGIAAVRKRIGRPVRSAEELQRETALPVLACIPVIMTRQDLRNRRAKRWYVRIGVLFFLTAALVAFALFVMDLDVLLANALLRFFP